MPMSYSDIPALRDLLAVETANKDCKIGGRKKELQKIINFLAKRHYQNILVYGNSGVGKRALIQKLIYTLSSEKKKKKYGKYQFLRLNVNKLATKSPKEISSFFSELSSYIGSYKENKPVLIIHNVDYLINNDNIHFELKQLLESDCYVIATQDNDENTASLFESSIYNLFECINMYMPLTTELYEMIKYQIKDLADFHKVKISENTAKYLIFASKPLYYQQEHEPRSILNILDGIMAETKLEGRTCVRKTDLFKYFSYEYDKFCSFSDERKKTLALHEVAHMIVLMSSSQLQNYIPIAISIIPSATFNGMIYFEYPPYLSETFTEDFYIQISALFLAGKIIQEIYGIPANTGASDDLQKANDFALSCAGLYALNPKLSDKILSEHLLSVSDGNLVSSMVDYSNYILESAREYACYVLYENFELIDFLSDKLIKKGIMTIGEFEELISEKLS